MGPVSYPSIDRIMGAPSKCIKMLGWSPKEVMHFLGFIEAEIVAQGAVHGNGHYRRCKASTLARLIVLLWSIQSSETGYRLEARFGWAKSSINDDKYYLGGLLLHILKREVGTLWPTHEEQEILISFLPDTLIGKKIFFIVDSTKVPNNDSLDRATREKHWNNKKGFGCHMIVFCDIFGRTLWFEPIRDGNGSDGQQYRSTAPFQQSRGCRFVAVHTGFGDSAYTGSSSNDPLSAKLVQKFNLDDHMFDNNPAAYDMAERFNDDLDTIRSTVERANRGIKQFAAIGHKSPISLVRGVGAEQ